LAGKSDFSVVPLTPIDDLLTPVDDMDEYLPYMRLIPATGEVQSSAKILKYDNSTCQLVLYDIRDSVATSVNITNSGSGYAPVPTVTFENAPSGGTTATGLAVVGSDGKLDSVVVTNPGSGYTTPPTVTFTSVQASLNIFGTAFVFDPENPLAIPIAVPDTNNPPTSIIRARRPGNAGNNIRIRFNGTSSNEIFNSPANVTSVDVSGTDITVNYYPIEGGLTDAVVKFALQTNPQANALVEMIILPEQMTEGLFLGEIGRAHV